MPNCKIKPTKIKELSTKIKPRPIAEPDMLRFSFKHLDFSHKKFTFKHRKGKYLLKLLERFKNLSTLKVVQDILASRSPALRAHPIKWEETSEPSGFKHLNSQLQDIPPYQFEISKTKHGRVHGFLLQNIFFVVWLDPEHKLYFKKN